MHDDCTARSFVSPLSGVAKTQQFVPMKLTGGVRASRKCPLKNSIVSTKFSLKQRLRLCLIASWVSLVSTRSFDYFLGTLTAISTRIQSPGMKTVQIGTPWTVIGRSIRHLRRLLNINDNPSGTEKVCRSNPPTAAAAPPHKEPRAVQVDRMH